MIKAMTFATQVSLFLNFIIGDNFVSYLSNFVKNDKSEKAKLNASSDFWGNMQPDKTTSKWL